MIKYLKFVSLNLKIVCLSNGGTCITRYSEFHFFCFLNGRTWFAIWNLSVSISNCSLLSWENMCTCMTMLVFDPPSPWSGLCNRIVQVVNHCDILVWLLKWLPIFNTWFTEFWIKISSQSDRQSDRQKDREEQKKSFNREKKRQKQSKSNRLSRAFSRIPLFQRGVEWL